MSNKKTIAIITNNIELSLLLKEQFDLQGIFSLKLFNEKSIDLALKKNEKILARKLIITRFKGFLFKR